MVSHELRGALNGIMGWSELLLSGELSIAETSAAAAAIYRQALRQARLLDDLLAAMHPAFLATNMQAAPIDMAAVIASVVQTMRPGAVAANGYQGADAPPLVLIVDNDRDTRTLYGRVLRSAGFRVGAACQADEALEYARTLLPAAIVTDLRLPGSMDGVDLIQALRADAALRDDPILAVTGHKPVGLTDAQVPTVLLKPISPRTLVTHVKAVLARSSAAGPK